MLPDELRKLMQRYCQLGCLLPQAEDFDAKDPRARAGVEVVLREMASVKAEIDEFLDAAREREPP
jgi:hypothetical protein